MAEEKKYDPGQRAYDRTDDDRAREAAENPLGTAGRKGPLPGLHGLGWGGPIVAVAIALIVLAIFVAVLL